MLNLGSGSELCGKSGPATNLLTDTVLHTGGVEDDDKEHAEHRRPEDVRLLGGGAEVELEHARACGGGGIQASASQDISAGHHMRESVQSS